MLRSTVCIFWVLGLLLFPFHSEVTSNSKGRFPSQLFCFMDLSLYAFTDILSKKVLVFEVHHAGLILWDDWWDMRWMLIVHGLAFGCWTIMALCRVLIQVWMWIVDLGIEGVLFSAQTSCVLCSCLLSSCTKCFVELRGRKPLSIVKYFLRFLFLNCLVLDLFKIREVLVYLQFFSLKSGLA